MTSPNHPQPSKTEYHTASSRALARLMDDLFAVPGTNFRVGLDPILGLIPGVGDVLGTAISGVILADAIRNRVPIHVLLLMGWNLILDSLLGLIPFAGDVADAAHRANVKNLRLLEQTVADGKRVHTDAKGYVLRAGLTVAVILVIIIALAVAAIWGLVMLISKI